MLSRWPLALFLSCPFAAGQCELDVLLPSGSTQEFGKGLSIDGGRLLVGAGGHAAVYEEQGGSWVETDQLMPSQPLSSSLGYGRSMALDGSVAVLGSMDHDLPNSTFNIGAAYVFEEGPTGWTQSAQLLASDGQAQDQFGFCVDVVGSTVFVGARFHGSAAMGAVYVYEGPTWSEVAKLQPTSLSNGSHFGRSLDADGNRLIVGANSGVSGHGAAYVFERQGSTWVEVQELTAFNPPGFDVNFGFAVGLSGDRAIVGALNYPGTGSGDGAVYLFQRQADQWNLDTLILAECWQVDMLGDRAVSGGLDDRVHWLRHDGSGWSEAAQWLVPEHGGNGGLVLTPDRVFAASDQYFGSSPRVRIYAPDPPATYCVGKPNSQGCIPQISVTGAASASGAFSSEVSAQLVVNQKNGLFFYGYGGRAVIPFQGGTLCFAPPTRRTPIQNSGGVFPCDGNFLFDLSSWFGAGNDPNATPGTLIRGQFWYRDPTHPDGTQVGLTNAAEVPICL